MNDEGRNQLINYAKSDLVCYFAASPDSLVERQREAWLPLLQWIKENYAVELKTGIGIRYVEQDAAVVNVISNLIDTLSSDNLNVLSQLARLTGSFVIAWAVVKKHINIEQAYNIAFIDDSFQLSRWGDDDEARQRLEAINDEMMFVSTMLS